MSTFGEQAKLEQALLAESGVHNFSPLSMELRLTVVASSTALAVRFDELLDKRGLNSSTFNLLANLRYSEAGRLTATEIAQRLVTKPRNVTPLLDRLESQGFIVRRPSTDDRRVSFIELTRQGERLLEELMPAVFASADGAMEQLTDEEKRACISALNKIRAGLERETENLTESTSKGVANG